MTRAIVLAGRASVCISYTCGYEASAHDASTWPNDRPRDGAPGRRRPRGGTVMTGLIVPYTRGTEKEKAGGR